MNPNAVSRAYHKVLPPPLPSPAWMDAAACRDENPEAWFPVAANDPAHEARAICRDCPVQVQCLNHALTAGETSGIWGGFDLEREKPRRME